MKLAKPLITWLGVTIGLGLSQLLIDLLMYWLNAKMAFDLERFLKTGALFFFASATSASTMLGYVEDLKLRDGVMIRKDLVLQAIWDMMPLALVIVGVCICYASLTEQIWAKAVGRQAPDLSNLFTAQWVLASCAAAFNLHWLLRRERRRGGA